MGLPTITADTRLRRRERGLCEGAHREWARPLYMRDDWVESAEHVRHRRGGVIRALDAAGRPKASTRRTRGHRGIRIHAQLSKYVIAPRPAGTPPPPIPPQDTHRQLGRVAVGVRRGCYRVMRKPRRGQRGAEDAWRRGSDRWKRRNASDPSPQCLRSEGLKTHQQESRYRGGH